MFLAFMDFALEDAAEVANFFERADFWVMRFLSIAETEYIFFFHENNLLDNHIDDFKFLQDICDGYVCPKLRFLVIL